MKTTEEWSDAAAESCPHRSGFRCKYECVHCLGKLFAAAQRDALEAAALISEEARVDRQAVVSLGPGMGMAKLTREIVAAIRKLADEVKP